MTREELKAHCERQIQQFERVEKIMAVTLNDWKRYEEHKLILELLEQEPQTFKWCTDCKEYDQENHCCHRWSKVIRDTIEEIKQEHEPIIDKIFCIVHPLSIMSTPELEHKAIMQIAEMLEPLCLPESEE